MPKVHLFRSSSHKWRAFPVLYQTDGPAEPCFIGQDELSVLGESAPCNERHLNSRQRAGR